jgi:DNA-3-methyladenine glycosylase
MGGEELMRARRSRGRARGAKPLRRFDLTAGPGKLCRALGVQMSHNGKPLSGPELVVADDGLRAGRDFTALKSPRVGITQATDKEWRFMVEGNAFVSRAPQNRQARTLAADKGGGRQKPRERRQERSS